MLHLVQGLDGQQVKAAEHYQPHGQHQSQPGMDQWEQVGLRNLQNKTKQIMFCNLLDYKKIVLNMQSLELAFLNLWKRVCTRRTLTLL